MFKHFCKLNFKSDNYLALRENCLIFGIYQIMKLRKIHGIYIYIYVHPNALFYLKTNLPGLQDVFKH